MWQRFTERARKAVFYASEEAMRHGEAYVGTEHLFLGLLRGGDCVACRVIQALGADLAAIQRDIESQLPQEEGRADTDMALTPRAKRTIDLAYDEARRLDNDFIGTEHVLLGLIAERAGLAARVLEKHGVFLDAARAEVVELQGASANQPTRRNDQSWIQPTVLEGSFVRLEPLTYAHANDLAEACDTEMFRFFPTFPETFDEKGLKQYIRDRYAMPTTVPFAIIHKASDKAIGSSSFFDIRPHDKGLEIGHTWIKKEHRGTKVNPETKLLMFGYAFETCGAIRVQQKTDLRNLQSQRAMLKMGCKQEGVLRHNMVMPDGYVRDSVYFSVLREEWPEVKQGLLDRLK
jgi:RimJ/RimL family protein N-acetyltransferase